MYAARGSNKVFDVALRRKCLPTPGLAHARVIYRCKWSNYSLSNSRNNHYSDASLRILQYCTRPATSVIANMHYDFYEMWCSTPHWTHGTCPLHLDESTVIVMCEMRSHVTKLFNSWHAIYNFRLPQQQQKFKIDFNKKHINICW